MQRQLGDCLQYRPGAKNGGHAPGPAARLAMLGSFVYRQSPVWAQETLISAKSSLRNMMREGASFEIVRAQVDEGQWWPEQALRDFQSQRMRTVVETSIRHVPYYRQRYGSPGLDFTKLQFPDALEHLPLLTKSDVRTSGSSLIAENRRVPLFSGNTNGKTGNPPKVTPGSWANK